MHQLTKQQLATSTILMVAHELLKPGRPRKLPGKPRAEATFTNGPFGAEPTSYRASHAQRYSLEGALKKAAYSIRDVVSAPTLSRARKQAESLVIKALNDQDDALAYVMSASDVDASIADNRAVLRAVKRAAKQYA